jgi:ferrous iron transport protein A
MRAPAPSSLAACGVGQRVTVVRVGCPRAIARRLLEMGLLPGTPVKVLRVAPLGDPIELELRGYALSIRRAEAVAIEVAPFVTPR